MEPGRPRLSLDELHLLRWLLGGVLMLLSIVTVFYMDIGSEWAAAAAAAGVLTCLVRPDLPARVPLWMHRLAFPAIVAFFVGDLWHSGALLPAIVRLDLLLLLYRGSSHRARRDDLQIVILGLFLVVVAGVLTVSILFAGQILLFTACALALLMVVTIASSSEGGQAPMLAVRGVEPSWARYGWARLFRRLLAVSDWRLLASALVLFLGVVAVSGLLFLAIPRFQLENSLFLERFVVRRAMTGFNDSIKFGDITGITQDDGIAFEADISDPNKAPASPYWRMVVLDEYHDGRFKLSSGMRATFGREATSSVVVPRLGGVSGSPPAWTFYVESGISRYLPVLGRFGILRFPSAQNYRYSWDLGIVALRDEPATMTAYRVENMAPESNSLHDPIFAGRKRGRGLAGMPPELGLDVPAADQAVLRRLDQAIGITPTTATRDFAQKAMTWLRQTHPYSLAPRIPAGPGDPLVRWVASHETGHCELFAGSLVVLARAAGIPARVVTGFKGGTWNAYSANYVIRNSDAHAWAELWDPTTSSWLREDPLEIAASLDPAPEEGAAAIASMLDRSWSARFSSLRVFWYRRIVNFDQQAQVDAARAVKAATDTSGKRIRETLAELGRRLRLLFAGPWNAARALRFAAALSAAGSLAWLGVTGRWRFRRGRPGHRDDPVRREAGRWLRRVDSPPKLVADLQRLRFGAPATWPRPTEVFRRARQAAPISRRRRASSRSTS